MVFSGIGSAISGDYVAKQMATACDVPPPSLNIGDIAKKITQEKEFQAQLQVALETALESLSVDELINLSDTTLRVLNHLGSQQCVSTARY